MSQLELGAVGNVFLFVPDLDEATQWYTRLLGREPERPMGQLVRWQFGATTLSLHSGDEYNSPGAAATGTMAYFDVPDVDVALAWCQECGGAGHRGPKTVFSGERLLQVLDPFDNLLGLRQPPAA